jgi:hypothetical protein
MRAYSRHDMLCVMPFGNYGEADEKGRPIDLPEGLHRLAGNLAMAKKKLRGMVEEVLALTATYAERVLDLAGLPDANKQNLVAVITRARNDLLRV